jgi:hypothetical protein
MSSLEDTGLDMNASQLGKVKPIHQPFSWAMGEFDDGRDAFFAALTLDVCNGIQTCLELVHATDLASGPSAACEEPPILGVMDRDRLLRLATVSARMLSDRAWKEVTRKNNQTPDPATAKEGSQ